MIALTLNEIASATNGALIGQNLTVENVFTDTRKTTEKALFIALIGENFDGHQFVDKAAEQGAIALLVSKKVQSELPQVLVEDTEKALGLVAKQVKNKVKPVVIGITGSAGKTSVKEMLGAILKVASSEEQVLVTKGNFNNQIGVPLTLLELTGQEKFAVIEMGANHLGEIAYCASLAEPQISVINNVAPAHIEGFGSIEGVAKAKAEIYQALKADGTAVINLDGDFAEQFLAMPESKKITFSRHKVANIQADNIELDDQQRATFSMKIEQSSCQVKLQQAGLHNVSNALAAAALATAAGIRLDDIKQGLEQDNKVEGRLNRFEGLAGCTLIDDSYNASVSSVKAAIDVLAASQGEKILVLGDMAELGDKSEFYHQQVGSYAKEKGVDKLYAVGQAVSASVKAFGKNGRIFTNKKSLLEQLKNIINSKQIILIKGSRSAHMEQVVEALKLEAIYAKESSDDLSNQLGGGHSC